MGCGVSRWACGVSRWACGVSRWACGVSRWACGVSRWACGVSRWEGRERQRSRAYAAVRGRSLSLTGSRNTTPPSGRR
ncbi:uncharacterized protein SOCEGT47_052990 [Sorangium cellulosum]|uniref:Uncharacterized protein n=1 Tax=Sorangium cellulosum TaxID=56 RepID=A0A4P2Q5T9_SORCE|nr:uncharacterized protein SOCEGT47_052990 [Sorangium cellulosum]